MPDSKIVSIQVAATIDRKLGQEESEFEVCTADDQDKTHWSVYTRNADGYCDHVQDFVVGPYCLMADTMVRTQALLLAAELSMEHSAFIEKIK